MDPYSSYLSWPHVWTNITCNKLLKSIHACPSSECDAFGNHDITISTDPRDVICKRYVNGCCLDRDCRNVHCAISALYYAENNVNISVNPIVKYLIWKEVINSCITDARYYWAIVNRMNEMLEFTICNGVRNIITLYIGSVWDLDESISIKTKNKELDRYVGWCNNRTNFILCDYYCGERAEHVAIKKIGDEYLILGVCDDCYNPNSPDAAKAMYDIGLTDFQIFPMDKLWKGINVENDTLTLHKNGTLKVTKFNPKD